MNAFQAVPLDPTDIAVLDNCLRAHRGASVLVLGAPCPMQAFQQDLRATAERLGFAPTGPGRFVLRYQPDGPSLLCWEPLDQCHEPAPVIH